jgi:tetratricopeptide (TPR) repeat protein
MALLLRAATVLIDRANRLSSALPLIERARAEHPESIDAALAWAKLQVALGRPRDALAALEDVVERNRGKRTPSLAPVYLAIGKAHLANDDLIEALEALKAGFAIESQRGELAMLVGLVALDVGDEKTAERAFLAVAMSAPRKDGSGASASDKVEASYRLAAMAYESGDYAKARRLASKAAGDDPAHRGAHALLEKLRSHAPPLSAGAR